MCGKTSKNKTVREDDVEREKGDYSDKNVNAL